MNFDMEKLIKRVTDYYGVPVRIEQGSDKEFTLSREPRAYLLYDTLTLASRIPKGSGIDVDAQIEAIKWLQGQTTNEFVLAWLVDKRGIVQRAGGVKA